MSKRKRVIRFAKAALAALLCAICAHAQEPQDHNAFLDQATRSVEEYTRTFVDLTAEEQMKIEFLTETGEVRKHRDTLSALIIYRSQSGSNTATEYRDVLSVDGKAVRDHEDRAIRLAQSLSSAKSVADELNRIRRESSRYNDQVQTVNITLMQGFPLRMSCRHLFQFGYAGTQTLGAVATRVYDYRQVGPCDNFQYRLMSLPADFRRGVKMHRGRLWIDEQGRLVREERDVYARSTVFVGAEVLAVRIVLEYGASAFGILTPKKITLVTYRPAARSSSMAIAMYPYVRVTQEYGGFSRFEVSVEQKVSEPEAKKP